MQTKILLVTLLLSLGVQAATVEIFVSPQGNDSSAGTFAAPVRSLAAAQDRARAARSGGQQVAVRLRGGEYRISRTLALGPEDGGVAWTAWRDERPVLTGGRPIVGFVPDGTNGAVVADAVKCGYRGLEPIPPSGFSESEPKNPEIIVRRHNALYWNGHRLTPARHPNAGFFHVDEIVDPKAHVIRSKELKPGLDIGPASAPDLTYRGYPSVLWADENRPCTYRPDGAITVSWPGSWGFHKGYPFMLENALAFMDRQGEWHLDRKAGLLHVIPPARGQARWVLAETPVPFVTLTNAANVRIEGLVFEYGRSDAVIARHADGFVFAGNVVRNFSGLGLDATGVGICLEGNVFRSIGFDAIRVEGGDRRTLTPSRNRIADNEISDTGFIQRTYVPGLLLLGCGAEIVRNHFHDMPSSAIRIEGNDHLVLSNLFERVVRESDDQGATDTFGDPSYGGIVFRHNVFRSIRAKGIGSSMACGIRFDDSISNMTVEGNRFEDASDGRFGGVQINMGRHNLITNNLMIGGSGVVSFTDADRPEVWRRFVGGRFRAPGNYRNLVDVTKEPWRTRYPWLLDPLNTVCTNTIVCNVAVGTRNGATLLFPVDTIADVGNVSFATEPAEAELARIPGFTLPPRADQVGPDSRNLRRRRAKANDR